MLGFSQSLLFGKVGRALLQPTIQRQYSKNPGRPNPLSPELADALKWRMAALVGAPPRPIPYRVVKPVLIYTEACGAGHVSAILFIDGVRRVRRSHLPEWFENEAGIFEYELSAVLLGMCVALCLAPGRPCFLCGDNMGARGAVVRGSCATVLGRALSSLWLISATSADSVWIEYVRSTLNSSDPLRACARSRTSRWRSRALIWAPRLFFDVSESRAALLRAQFAAPPSGATFCEAWPRIRAANPIR